MAEGNSRMKMTDGIEYAAVRLLAGFLRLLPLDTAIGLGARLGRAADNLWLARHKVILRNLEIAFGDELTPQRREELAREIFGNLGKTLAEICHFQSMNRDDILRRVTSEGEDSFREVQQHGRGAILVGGHFGNWELVGAYIRALGYPVDFLIRGQHNRLVDNFLTNIRLSYGVGVIHSDRGGMKDVIRALKENRQVAIVSDQHAGSGGIVVKFFGQLVSVPRAPATLAVRCNAPIVTGYIIRMADNRHHCRFEPPLYPDQTADPSMEILRLTRLYTKRIEDAIRLKPDHWLWTHRRFKPLPPEKLAEGSLIE